MHKPEMLHIVPSFGLGGMEKIICSIISHTADRYHHKLLALDGIREALQWIPSDIEAIDFQKPVDNIAFFKKLRHVLTHTRADFLMTYNWGATDAIWLGRLHGIHKIIHHEHGFNIDEAQLTSRKRDVIRFILYRMASQIIVVSQSLKTLLRTKYYLKENKLEFIPNGLNIDDYHNSEEKRNKFRHKLGFKPTDFVLGFSGRLDPIKNFDLMLRIFTFCLQKEANFKFLFIGDGPERPRLEEWCHCQGITEHVLFVGRTERVLPYLGCMDMFLLTSFREQMPMSILESMAMGIPVLATSVGDIPFMIENHINGFVRNLHDSLEEFVQPIFSMKNHQEHAKMIGQMARKKVAIYQENHMIQRYIDVIERC